MSRWHFVVCGGATRGRGGCAAGDGCTVGLLITVVFLVDCSDFGCGWSGGHCGGCLFFIYVAWHCSFWSAGRCLWLNTVGDFHGGRAQGVLRDGSLTSMCVRWKIVATLFSVCNFLTCFFRRCASPL